MGEVLPNEAADEDAEAEYPEARPLRIAYRRLRTGFLFINNLAKFGPFSVERVANTAERVESTSNLLKCSALQ